MREYFLFFSQRREGAKKSLTTFAACLVGRLCTFARVFFLGSQRKKAYLPQASRESFFYSRKVEKAQRKLVK